jgi:succinyl-CoA synthetase alpha subunit
MPMRSTSAWVPEQEYFEYHGSTIVERIQVVNGGAPLRDWLLFDTVEEAADYYNENRLVN